MGDEQRADREAVGKTLRERDRVGFHAELLPREEAAGAADAGLHLVEDQQRAVLVRKSACLCEELRRERVDAALALHRLEQDRRCARPDVLKPEARARDERLERRTLRGLPRDRKGTERAPVERAVERDDLGAARRLARPLERGLDRLRTRVAEERARAAEPVGELRRELLHRRRPVEVRHVPEPVELRVRRSGRRRVAMTEPDDGDSREQIEVAVALVVHEPRPLAVDERDVEPRVRRQH